MPDNALHYINLGASIIALVVVANFGIATGGFLAASLFLKKFRVFVTHGMICLGLSLVASALAYQWFSNAMGW